MFKPEDALPWVSAGMILFILIRQEKTLSALDDLKAADAAETAEISTVGQALQEAITRIGQITIPPGVSEADAATITADINAHVASLQVIATALATVAPATTDTPQPDGPVGS